MTKRITTLEREQLRTKAAEAAAVAERERGEREKAERVKLLEGVRYGLYPVDAAAWARVSPERFAAMMGEEAFALDVGAAIAERRLESTLRLKAAAQGGTTKDGKTRAPQWFADGWFLERTAPEMYAVRQFVNVQIQKQLKVALEALEEALPREWFERAVEAIAARVGVPVDEADQGGATPSSGTRH